MLGYLGEPTASPGQPLPQLASVEIVAVHVADARSWLDALPGAPLAERRIGKRTVTERDASVVRGLRNTLITGQVPPARWWTWIEGGNTAVSLVAYNVGDDDVRAGQITGLGTPIEMGPVPTLRRLQRPDAHRVRQVWHERPSQESDSRPPDAYCETGAD